MGIMSDIKTFGSRAEVLHGNAKKTTGNLTKVDLKKNKYGKIVSKAASNAAKKTKNLGEHLAPKGSKVFVLASKNKKSARKSAKKSAKKRCPKGSRRNSKTGRCRKNKSNKKSNKSKKSKKSNKKSNKSKKSNKKSNKSKKSNKKSK